MEKFSCEKEDILTVRKAFVNDDYKTHSQFTETYMVQEGLYREDALEEAGKAVKEYEKKYK